MLTRAALLLPPDQPGYAAHYGDGQHGYPGGDQRPMPGADFAVRSANVGLRGADRLIDQEPFQIVRHLLDGDIAPRGLLAVALSTIVSRSRGMTGRHCAVGVALPPRIGG